MRQYWVLFLVIIMFMMATGCQTSHPTSINKSSATISQTGDSDSWNPECCIVFVEEPDEKKASREFRTHIAAAAKSAKIKLYTKINSTHQEDIIIQITNVGNPVTSVSNAMVYSDSHVSCTYNCLDKEGNVLEGGTLFGNGHASQTPVAITASLLIGLGTLDMSRPVEKNTMENSASRAAFKDLAANIVNLASNSARIRQMLLEATKKMDATEITNLAVALFIQEQYSKAEFYLNEAVRRFPEYQPAFCYLGACQTQLGRHDEAHKNLTTAIQLDPHTQEAQQAQEWVAMLDSHT